MTAGAGGADRGSGGGARGSDGASGADGARGSAGAAGPGGPGPVGSIGEEAARLLAALQDRYGGPAADWGAHVGAEECGLCPVCQLLRLLRTARPEAYEHLAAAATSLAAAAREIVDAAEGHGPERSPRRHGVEHIDIG